MMNNEPEFDGYPLSMTPGFVLRDLWIEGKISNEDYCNELFRRAKVATARKAEFENLKAENLLFREALLEIIRQDDTGPMTYEARENGPSQAIGGSKGKFAKIAVLAMASANAK